MAEAAAAQEIELYDHEEWGLNTSEIVPERHIKLVELSNISIEPDITSEVCNFARSPESEVYGRSLSTIYRLGAFMTGKAAPEIINSSEADQARIEFYTSVEEGFGTDVELGVGLEVRDFDIRPIVLGKVMAKDLKTPVSAMTRAGYICGSETAKKDPRFLPQLTRSEWDHKNALLVDEMAKGVTEYNTRIVVSPFPQEGAEESGNEYWQSIGYVPHLKRGFVQLYHASEDGVTTGSLSFDGSEKERLREVFIKYGVEIPKSETTDNWLKYAITETLSEYDAKELALEIADQLGDPKYKKDTNTVDVTREYGSIMDNVFNDSYVHVCESLFRGYQTSGATKLINQLSERAGYFNNRYAAALNEMTANKDKFTDDDAAVLHELLVYSTIEMLRALHLRKKVISKIDYGTSRNSQIDIAYLIALDPPSFQGVLSGFGAEGARNNRTYSACGLSISLGENVSRDLPQNAFGGKDIGISEDKYGSLTFKCPKGHLNTRPRGKLIENCQTCGVSVSC